MKKILTILSVLLASSTLVNCANNTPHPANDYDSDGLVNEIDPDPKNNKYKVKIDDKYSSQIDITINYYDFIKDGYNKNLALLASLFLNDPVIINNVYEPSLKEKSPIFGQMGLQDIIKIELNKDDYDDDPYDLAGVTLGHHLFTDAKDNKYHFFFGEINAYVNYKEQWISNFDIGAWDEGEDTITKGYKEFWNTNEHKDWLDHQMHKGFDVAANRLKEKIDDYISEHEDKSAQKIIILVGHSRGAAIANIIAKKYIDEKINTKAFCFNPPMVTKDENDKEKYKNIFSFINANDIVSRVPCPKYWHFTNYGVPFTIDVASEGKDLFKKLYGYDYSFSAKANKKALDIIELLLADLSCLEEPTKLNTCDSDNMYEIGHYPDPDRIFDVEIFDSEEDANDFISDMNTFADEHCLNSVEFNAPVEETSEWIVTWQCKGAIIMNFMIDALIKDDIEDVLSHYMVLFLDRLIADVLYEYPDLIYDLADIVNGFQLAHKTEITCVLAMCANKK